MNTIPIQSTEPPAEAVPAAAATKPSLCPESLKLLALLLTDAQCAELCSCSRRTWRTWDGRKLTPASTKIAGSRRWLRESVLAWAQMGCPARDVFEARMAAESAAKAKGARR